MEKGQEITNKENLCNITKIKTTYKVTKSNNLIDAIYKLNTNEQKILIILISLLDPINDREFKTYKIPVSTIQEVLKNKGNTSFYTELKDITINILKKPLRYKYQTKNGKRRELQTNWFSHFIYYDSEGYIEVGFNENLKPLLLKLRENFTTYMLIYVMKLKSKYSIRLYEILKKIEYQANKVIFPLEELRPALGLSDSEYIKYNDFKKRVLEIAKFEINESTDLLINYKEVKDARKITRIVFTLKTNEKNLIAKEDELDLFNLNPLGYKLMEFNISEHQARKIIEKHTPDFIEDKINQLKYLLKYHPEKVNGKGRYLYNSMMAENAPWNDDDYIKYKEQLKTQDEKKTLKELKHGYEKYRQTFYIPYEQLSETEKTEIDKKVEDWKKSVNIKILTDERMEIMKEGKIEQLIIDLKSNNILSFDEWRKEN